MKKEIYIILLLLYSTLVHAYVYQISTPIQQPKTRFGYTTNYSNGQYTPSTYYNPYNTANNNSRSIRKVKGYTAWGDSIDTDNNGKRGNPENMWENGYRYYYDGGYWYRNENGVWEKWSTALDWGLLGWSWRNRNPGDNPTEYFKDKPIPIGEPTIPLLILMFAHLSYKEIKKRRRCKHFFFVKLFGYMK